MFSDFELRFEEHLGNIVCKVNKSTGLLCKLQTTFLPKKSVVTINKFFTRRYLDNGNVIYDQTFNKLFQERFETIK